MQAWLEKTPLSMVCVLAAWTYARSQIYAVSFGTSIDCRPTWTALCWYPIFHTIPAHNGMPLQVSWL